MADTTIDFGAGNTTRYYTIPAFTLPNSDWAMVWWERFSQPADGGRRVVFSTDGIGEGGAINIETAHYDETGYETIAGIWDTNGNGSFYGSVGQSGTYTPGQDTLVVLQRRGLNIEIWRVPTGVTATAPFFTEAHPFTAGHNGVGNATYYIGRRADGTRSRIEPFGEFAVLNNRSLSTAEINTLAAGAHITAVESSPYIDLRFRESNATEPDLGTANLDATQFGTGWTLDDEFFPDGSEGGVTTMSADDSLVTADNLLSSVLRFRSQLDLVEISESPFSFKVCMATILDSLQVSDTSFNFAARNRQLIDELGITDQVAKLLLFSRLATEVLVTSEGNLENYTVYEALAGSAVELVDEYLRSALHRIVTDDSFTLIDSYLSSATGQQIINLVSDSLITMSWQALSRINRNRLNQDTTALFDQTDSLMLRKLIAGSAVEILDETVLQFIKVIVSSDVANIIDNISSLVTGLVTVDPRKTIIGVDQPKIILGGYVV